MYYAYRSIHWFINELRIILYHSLVLMIQYHHQLGIIPPFIIIHIRQKMYFWGRCCQNVDFQHNLWTKFCRWDHLAKGQNTVQMLPNFGFWILPVNRFCRWEDLAKGQSCPNLDFTSFFGEFSVCYVIICTQHYNHNTTLQFDWTTHHGTDPHHHEPIPRKVPS